MKYFINDKLALSRPPEGPVAGHIISFAEWLVGRGYGLVSLRNQVLMADGFSRWLQQKGVGLSDVGAEDPERYLLDRARDRRPKLGDSAALRHLLDFLRSRNAVPEETKAEHFPTPIEQRLADYERFLQDARALSHQTIINYRPDARYRGDIASDLAAAVPVVANWSLSSIPRAIGRDAVTRLLASIDRETAVGCRDYAMILALARLGLRSSEVVLLELDDIDWVVGQIRVRGKNGQRHDLPLPMDVGEAIADYLQKWRPRNGSRRVFLRDKAPIRGFKGPSGLGCVIRRSLKRAGIDAPTTGTHQFRHGLASEMLRGGASLGEIGEVLGHRHVQTTVIYAKVDLNALRTLALPWPGEVQ